MIRLWNSLKIKIAQESDAEVRNKYSRLKKTCSNLGKDIERANETINELKNGRTTMERAAQQMEAKILGFEACADDNEQSSRTEEQMVELLHLREVLLDGKEKEALELKERIKKLEADSEGSERLQVSHE